MQNKLKNQKVSGVTKNLPSPLLPFSGFILQKRSQRPKCGCYVLNHDIIKNFQNMAVAVPLEHIDYNIEIINNIAKISLEQQYLNPLNSFLELEYSFPIRPQICIYKFVAKFDNVQISGLVLEKQQAKKQYDEGLKKGQQVAYGQIDNESKDIMNLKIGNIPPDSPVKITIEYLCQLTTTLNTFWQLMILSTISPRYMNQKKVTCCRIAKLKEKIQLDVPKYKWSFKITLKSNKRCIYANSKTHSLLKISNNQTDTQMIYVMQESCIPNKDFTFVYTTQNFQTPVSVLGKNDINKSAAISFIPKFFDLKADDAFKMQLKNQQPQFDFQCAKGQYLFLLDRSGSMQGKRMQKAKQALIFFLRSLPQDSYFDIYSFGSGYNSLMKKQEQKYSQISLKNAINQIKTFSANMGGTEIYFPLKNILEKQLHSGYPRHIFILTDGGVSNTDQIIQLVKNNIKFNRVHTIGIGNGASEALIQGCAKKGKGKYIFIKDQQNVSAKVIEMLSAVMSPVITNLEVNFDHEKIEAIIPNPKQMPYILKNEPFTLYLLFKNQFQGNTQIKISYIDSIHKVKCQNSIIINSNDPSYQFIDRMAHYKSILILQEGVQNENAVLNDMLISKIANIKQHVIKQSIKYQVLCRYTAFLCVGKELIDGKYEQYKNCKVQKVQVPQILPQEYQQHQVERCKKPTVKMMSRKIQPNLKKTMISTLSSSIIQKPQMKLPKKSTIGIQRKQMDSQLSYDVQQYEQKLTKRQMKLQMKKSQPKKQKEFIKNVQSLTQAEKIQNILNLQKIDGSWDMSIKQIFSSSFKISEITFNNIISKYIKEQQINLIVTIIVVRYMEKYHNSAQYSLIIKKSKNYINKNIEILKKDQEKWLDILKQINSLL